MNKYEALEKLNDLRQKGIISEEEFLIEKQKILAGNSFQGTTAETGKRPWGMDINTYCMLMHLSQFLGFIVPFLGWIMPLLMWLLNKDAYPMVNRQGAMIMNWIITVVIASIVFAVLSIIIIGIPLLIALLVCDIVFTILGAVNASKGEYWPYPLRIPIIPEKE